MVLRQVRHVRHVRQVAQVAHEPYLTGARGLIINIAFNKQNLKRYCSFLQ